MKQTASQIKDVVDTVILKMSGEKKGAVDRLQDAWKAAIDKKAHSHARPAGFKAKKLVVNVDSSAWMYELNMRKEQIRQAMNAHLGGKEAIKELVLRIGEVG